MTNATAQRQTAAEPDGQPLDITVMRRNAAQLLGPDDGPEALPPAPQEVVTLAALLREHLEQLIPAVEAQARRLPTESIPRYCALACIGEATRKLRIGDGATEPVRLSVAGKLARSVWALCDHYAKLAEASRASTRP
ncbi:DUF6415 family natural product biosynthesis protein [Streptomyces sp. 1222.5]|uniref:DUF6415 family natural product biosynthesis protein n=1 Tax=Streptomyces sp. 1222.5 TaxID=1881026 RepID=UPI003EB74D1F